MQALPRLALLIAAPAAALIAGCAATPMQQPISGYTCCNLRATQGWVSSNNVQGGDLIPAGSTILLNSIKRQYYLYGRIGSAEYGLRADSAKTEQDTMRWVQRVVVAEDPSPQLAAWPGEVRAAVGAARVFVGMKRAQVAMALGYPSPTDTPELSASLWRYWTPAEDLPVDLRFDAEGTLVELIGKASAVRTLEMQR